MSTSTTRQPIRWNAKGKALIFTGQCVLGAMALLGFCSMFILVFGGQP